MEAASNPSFPSCRSSRNEWSEQSQTTQPLNFYLEDGEVVFTAKTLERKQSSQLLTWMHSAFRNLTESLLPKAKTASRNSSSQVSGDIQSCSTETETVVPSHCLALEVPSDAPNDSATTASLWQCGRCNATKTCFDERCRALPRSEIQANNALDKEKQSSLETVQSLSSNPLRNAFYDSHMLSPARYASEACATQTGIDASLVLPLHHQDVTNLNSALATNILSFAAAYISPFILADFLERTKNFYSQLCKASLLHARRIVADATQFAGPEISGVLALFKMGFGAVSIFSGSPFLGLGITLWGTAALVGSFIWSRHRAPVRSWLLGEEDSSVCSPYNCENERTMEPTFVNFSDSTISPSRNSTVSLTSNALSATNDYIAEKRSKTTINLQNKYECFDSQHLSHTIGIEHENVYAEIPFQVASKSRRVKRFVPPNNESF